MIEVHRRVVWTGGLCEVICDAPWIGTNQRKGDWDKQKHKVLDDKEMGSSPN
jgi:hypothetical protein